MKWFLNWKVIKDKRRLKRTDSGHSSDEYNNAVNSDTNGSSGTDAHTNKKKSGFINFSAAKDREKSKQSASLVRY